jgi:hypothetical protein
MYMSEAGILDRSDRLALPANIRFRRHSVELGAFECTVECVERKEKKKCLVFSLHCVLNAVTQDGFLGGSLGCPQWIREGVALGTLNPCYIVYPE